MNGMLQIKKKILMCIYTYNKTAKSYQFHLDGETIGNFYLYFSVHY